MTSAIVGSVPPQSIEIAASGQEGVTEPCVIVTSQSKDSGASQSSAPVKVTVAVVPQVTIVLKVVLVSEYPGVHPSPTAESVGKSAPHAMTIGEEGQVGVTEPGLIMILQTALTAVPQSSVPEKVAVAIVPQVEMVLRSADISYPGVHPSATAVKEGMSSPHSTTIVSFGQAGVTEPAVIVTAQSKDRGASQSSVPVKVTVVVVPQVTVVLKVVLVRE